DLFNLAPKKPDWDLKRELEKKLEKLERKTATCIATIIRERLKSQGEVTDLGGTVDASNAGAGGDESGDEA
ncbi:Coiled-coil domain-containing protein 12, partial [Quaeritorhiza haematococci]